MCDLCLSAAGFAANGTNQLPSAPAGTPATVAQGQAPLVAQAALTQAQAAAANMRQGLTAVMGSFGECVSQDGTTIHCWTYFHLFLHARYLGLLKASL